MQRDESIQWIHLHTGAKGPIATPRFARLNIQRLWEFDTRLFLFPRGETLLDETNTTGFSTRGFLLREPGVSSCDFRAIANGASRQPVVKLDQDTQNNRPTFIFK